MLKRFFIGLLVLVVLGVVGIAILSWRPAIAAIAPPTAGSFSPELIKKGEVIANTGFCETCHTGAGGKPYAGGYAFKTPFGTIYSTNITPDPDTGIGAWSQAAFARAMTEGVRRDGAHLYPAFPYDHFTKVRGDDIQALYAYLMTQPAVSQTPPPNTLPFPLNVRALEWGWKLLEFDPGEFKPDPNKSAEWNRGAYLAEGLGHCSACHTPRNFIQAEKGGDAKYAGAVVDGWYAPPLNASNPAPLPWNASELHEFLGTGSTALHGSAAGSMGAVSSHLAKIPDGDVAAIATYFADVDGSGGKSTDAQGVIAKALAASGSDAVNPTDHGARLYRAACAHCHYNSDTPQKLRPELALNTSLHADNPNDLVQAVLQGVSLSDGIPNVMMPPFAAAFSDADIADLTRYLRRTRTEQPAWTDLESKIAALRKEGFGG
jgi:mono/diheme cytochrome c family protein